MALALREPYISVSNQGKSSYGGNQMLSDSKTEREVGCGVVAGLDLLLYLTRYHLQRADCGLKLPAPTSGPIPASQYYLLLSSLRRKFLPLIPGRGINGLMLALGLNACFIKNRLPFLATWGVPYSRLWSSIRQMLENDIPVIFSIGPNFPLFWQQQKLPLYLRNADGVYAPVAKTHSHYVMITGIDEDWVQISSWGKQYYINRLEYERYVKEHSARLFSNILYIKKKSHGES